MVDSMNLLQLQDCDGSDDEFEKRVERVIEEYQQKRAANQIDLAVADLQKLLNGQLVIAHQLIANHHSQALAAVRDLLKTKEETIKRLKDELDRNHHRPTDQYTGKSAGTGESPTPQRREDSKIRPRYHSETHVPGSMTEGAWTPPAAPAPRLTVESMASDVSSVTAITQYRQSQQEMSPKGTLKGRKNGWHNGNSALLENKKDPEESGPGLKRQGTGTARERETLRQSVSCNVYAMQHQAQSRGQNVKMLEGKSEANGVFADAQAMKERVKEAIMKPEYNVATLYKKTGCWQAMARSNMFDNLTLLVIAINALWIAVDTNENEAATLLDADLVFVIAENIFCVYFTGELFIRFMAFNRKRDVIKDYWFIFDFGLVFMMVIETWLVTLVLWLTGHNGGGSGLGNASILRLIRLLRLTRMARMARLLRAMPELMILVKGVVVATRSVFFTLCLLVLIIYIFAIAFTQLAEDQVPEIKDKYFSSVFDSMNTLLLRGILPDLADMVNGLGKENYLFATLFLFFILLSSLTVMNMLVGVLVEVVKVVSSVEKEQMTIQFVKTKLQSMLDICNIDADGNQYISKDEFEVLLLQPAAARIIQEVGVDVVGLVDFADFIFQDGIELSFAEFLEVVLQLRGTNCSTVRDIVDLRKFFLTQLQDQLQESTVTMMESFSNDLKMQFKVEGAEMTKQVSKTMVTALEAEIRHVKAWPRPNDNRGMNGNNDNHNEKSVKFNSEESTALATTDGVTTADMTPFAGSRSRSNSPTNKRPQRPQRSHSPRVRTARRPWSGNVKVTESAPPAQSLNPVYQQTPLPAFPHLWVEDIDTSTSM